MSKKYSLDSFTRTAKTEEDYLKNVKAIAMKGAGIDSLETLFIMVNSDEELIYSIFSDAIVGLSIATSRKYSSSIAYWLKVSGINYNPTLLHSYVDKNRSNRPKLKKKYYPKSVREQVVSKLLERDGCSKSLFLIRHLSVGYAIGYRISELIGMKVSDKEGGYLLTIINGKNSNGRANGEVREILVPRVVGGYDVKESIQIMQKVMSDHEKSIGSIDKFIGSLSVFHYRLMRKLFPKNTRHHTLTSPRHQFKLIQRTKSDRRTVAASMGHKSIDTQDRSYGTSRGKGNPLLDESLIVVSVSEESISHVGGVPAKERKIIKPKI